MYLRFFRKEIIKGLASRVPMHQQETLILLELANFAFKCGKGGNIVFGKELVEFDQSQLLRQFIAQLLGFFLAFLPHRLDTVKFHDFCLFHRWRGGILFGGGQDRRIDHWRRCWRQQERLDRLRNDWWRRRFVLFFLGTRFDQLVNVGPVTQLLWQLP